MNKPETIAKRVVLVFAGMVLMLGFAGCAAAIKGNDAGTAAALGTVQTLCLIMLGFTIVREDF